MITAPLFLTGSGANRSKGSTAFADVGSGFAIGVESGGVICVVESLCLDALSAWYFPVSRTGRRVSNSTGVGSVELKTA